MEIYPAARRPCPSVPGAEPEIFDVILNIF
jgi:hypothetical protein